MPYQILLASGSNQLTDKITNILSLAEDEFHVDFIDDQEKIITQISQTNPEIILFDSKFLDGASADLISIIKNDPKTIDIPIIAIADFCHPEKIQSLFHAGADDFIGQPISDSELIQRIMVGIQRGRLLSKLKTQSTHFDSITSAISLAGNSVVIISETGEIQWVNEGFKKLYECPLEYFKNIVGDNLFDPKTNPSTLNAMIQCREKGESVVYENKWITPRGKEKYIQTNLTPIFDDLGNFAHIIAIETDITELKYIQRDLAEKRDHLLDLTENLENNNNILNAQQEKIQKQAEQLEVEKQKSENLLLNILPLEVANALQKKGKYKPKKFKEVSVMFADFVGFSKISKIYENIEEFLSVLSNYFEAFDEITSQRYIEKIKTIGDSYMCVGGIPRINRSHPFDTVLAALEIQRFTNEKASLAATNKQPLWKIRIGIHTGSVIAGVIGKQKFAYDIWGDTVNVASRIETACEPEKINISETTYNYIKDYFICTYRGKIPAKNIGEIDMYFVERIKPEYSEDSNGFIPNAALRKVVSSF
ncbi:MAG: PAS domain-containing protein [Bacteroidales bacterium]|nr:PAS domain-containing protein [Bacteroidales bacterium]HPD96197.1 adenylate/guanylate cyclase domain-containing protein [Tenuifilaceae bacterium]HRX31788.1 adenylate/guanylate cyclase domain-containing protein [Tenuifilaceae bacterium]